MLNYTLDIRLNIKRERDEKTPNGASLKKIINIKGCTL